MINRFCFIIAQLEKKVRKVFVKSHWIICFIQWLFIGQRTAAFSLEGKSLSQGIR